MFVHPKETAGGDSPDVPGQGSPSKSGVNPAKPVPSDSDSSVARGSSGSTKSSGSSDSAGSSGSDGSSESPKSPKSPGPVVSVSQSLDSSTGADVISSQPPQANGVAQLSIGALMVLPFVAVFA